MEVLVGSGAERGVHNNPGIVSEFELSDVAGDQGDSVFDFLREVVISELHLVVEERLSRLVLVGDNTGVGVGDE